MKLNRKQIINILNNDGGIVSEEVHMNKRNFFTTYEEGEIVNIGINAIIERLKYCDDYEGSKGLVVYRILGEIKIKEFK